MKNILEEKTAKRCAQKIFTHFTGIMVYPKKIEIKSIEGHKQPNFSDLNAIYINDLEFIVGNCLVHYSALTCMLAVGPNLDGTDGMVFSDSNLTLWLEDNLPVLRDQNCNLI